MESILAEIGFDQYKINCIIGVEPHERKCEQEIYVDMRVEVDIEKASNSDSIEDTVDYVLLASLCKQIAQDGRYHLLEKYAKELLEVVLSKFNVNWAWVRIRKPGAISNAQAAVFELKRVKE